MNRFFKPYVVAATLLLSACFGGGPGDGDIKNAMLEQVKEEIAQMAAFGSMMGGMQLKMALLSPVGAKALGWARNYNVADYRDNVATVSMEIADRGVPALREEESRRGKFKIASLSEGVPEEGWNQVVIRIPGENDTFREAMEAKKEPKIDIAGMQVHGKEEKGDGTWVVTVSAKFVAEGKGEKDFTGEKITLVERDGKWVVVK